jgi:hypothetical protein
MATELEDAIEEVVIDLEDLSEDEAEEVNTLFEVEHTHNLAFVLEEEELKEIGEAVVNSCEEDDKARDNWKQKTREAMIALGLDPDKEVKSDKGFTSIIHPGLCIGNLRLWSRMVKEFWPLTGPVKTDVQADANPEILSRADRQQKYLNAKLLYGMPEAFTEDSLASFNLGIHGSSFKKVYRDERGKTRDRYVSAWDLIIPFHGDGSLESCPRISEKITMTRSELLRGMALGKFRRVELNFTPETNSETTENPFATDGEQKVSKSIPDDMAEVFTVIEQHVDLDLEEDSYPLPYLIKVLEGSKEVIALYRNWVEGDIEKLRIEFYSHEKLPSPYAYGLGLYHQAPGLVATQIDSLRSLIDAGRHSNHQSGFITETLARKLQNVSDISPGVGEFITVPAAYEDLRKGFYSMDYKEPSTALFNLLQLMDNYQERLFNTTDTAMGDIGSSMPVGTASIANENANMVPNSILLAIHFAKRKEMKMLRDRCRDELIETQALNGAMPVYKGVTLQITPDDLADDLDVLPTNDPQQFSLQAMAAKARDVYQLAQHPATGLDLQAVERFVLETLRVPNYEGLMKPPAPPQGPPPPSPDIAAKAEQIQTKTQLMVDDHQGKQAEREQRMALKETNATSRIQGAQTDQALAARQAEFDQANVAAQTMGNLAVQNEQISKIKKQTELERILSNRDTRE